MIESIGFTPTRKRANKIQNNIEDILKESREKVVEQKETVMLESAMNRDIAFNGARSVNEVGKTVRTNEKTFSEAKLENYLITEAFANIVLNSVPLDESFKEKNAQAITKKASAVFKGLYENGIIQEGNYMWKEYYGTVSESAPLLKEHSGDLIAVEKILQETEMKVKETGKGISSIIETKIVEVISDEKLIAEQRTELMESNKKFSGSTLFNALTVANVKAVNTSDKFVNVPKDKMMDIAFAESLVDYTILETLNTFNLVNFSIDGIAQGIKHL